MMTHTCIECYRKLKTVNAELLYCDNRDCKRYGLVTVISDLYDNGAPVEREKVRT